MTEAHQARQGLTCGSMDLVGTRLREDMGCIGCIHSATRHDDQGGRSLLYQPTEHRDASLSRRGLPRSEQTVAPGIGYLLKCAEGVGTEVESTVKRDRTSVSLLHAFMQKVQVHLPVGIERTDHHTVCTCFDAGRDVVEDDVLLGFSVKEITASRADEHMVYQPVQGAHRTYQSEARGESAFAQTATEFHPVSTGLLGHLCAIVTAAADFEFIHNGFRIGTLFQTGPTVLRSEDTNKCWEARCISPKN